MIKNAIGQGGKYNPPKRVFQIQVSKNSDG